MPATCGAEAGYRGTRIYALPHMSEERLAMRWQTRDDQFSDTRRLTASRRQRRRRIMKLFFASTRRVFPTRTARRCWMSRYRRTLAWKRRVHCSAQGAVFAAIRDANCVPDVYRRPTTSDIPREPLARRRFSTSVNLHDG
jgi:hypothetical protein